jgi:hypothetical protein
MMTREITMGGASVVLAFNESRINLATMFEAHAAEVRFSITNGDAASVRQ